MGGGGAVQTLCPPDDARVRHWPAPVDGQGDCNQGYLIVRQLPKLSRSEATPLVGLGGSGFLTWPTCWDVAEESRAAGAP